MKYITWDYLAGFVDADGNIAIHTTSGSRKSNRGRKRLPCSVQVHIVQKRPEILVLIKNMLRLNGIECYIDKQQEKYYYLHIGKTLHALTFLYKIQDKLIIKRERAKRALKLSGYDLIQTL